MTRHYVGIEDGIPSYVDDDPRVPVEFDAVLIKTLDDQRDRNGDKIDPAGVTFDPDKTYLIHWNFDYGIPPLGKARVSRAEDGSLVVHGELWDTDYWGRDIQPKLAAGVRTTTISRVREGATIAESTLLDMALCHEHSDPEQPPIVIHAQIRSDS